MARAKRSLEIELDNPDFLDRGWIGWLVQTVVFLSSLGAVLVFVRAIVEWVGLVFGLIDEASPIHFVNAAVLLMLAVSVQYLRRLDLRQRVILEELNSLRPGKGE
ncbi:MAG: hypothetical protein AAGF88_10900 [Pseudomonadota bacterium]